MNVINQSVIGAKEGVVEAVTKLVGSDITDAVLRTANGSNHSAVMPIEFDVMPVNVHATI